MQIEINPEVPYSVVFDVINFRIPEKVRQVDLKMFKKEHVVFFQQQHETSEAMEIALETFYVTIGMMFGVDKIAELTTARVYHYGEELMVDSGIDNLGMINRGLQRAGEVIAMLKLEMENINQEDIFNEN